MQSDITVWHTISGKNFDLTFDQKVEADVHAEGTLKSLCIILFIWENISIQRIVLGKKRVDSTVS